MQPQLQHATLELAMPRPGLFFGAALAAGAFFAAWTWLVLGHHAVPAFDEDCAAFWHKMAREHRWGFMVYFTDLGGVATMAMLTLLGALWQASLKNRLLAFAWIGVMIGCGLLNAGTKQLINRPRPEQSMRDKAVLEENQSYPSGHSMGSAIGYGLLAYTLCLWQTCLRRRVLIVSVTTCVILAIGFSRMYLRAHWFSDVIGGWAIGLTWLFFCLGWLERWRIEPATRAPLGARLADG